MKSKIRNITVLDRHFVWNVKSISSNYICLKIWIKDNKKMPWVQIRYRFDDPWLHYGEIITMKKNPNSAFKLQPLTPKIVSNLIINIIQNNNDSCEFFSTLNYELTNGNLNIISNALEPGEKPF